MMAPLLHGLGFKPHISNHEPSRSLPGDSADGDHVSDGEVPIVQVDASETYDRSLKDPNSSVKHTELWGHVAFVDDANKLVKGPASFAQQSKAAPNAGLVREAEPSQQGSDLLGSLPRKVARKIFTLGGPSPFPLNAGPSKEECQHIHHTLSQLHEKREMPENIPPPSQTVAGCGEVNFVLDALMRTLVSTHTQMKNANRAIENVCTHYPVFQSGDYAGSVDWDMVLLLGTAKLEEAIRPAGKSVITSKAIISILEEIHAENASIRTEIKKLRPSVMSKAGQLTRAEILARRAYEELETNNSFITLDYLHLEHPGKVFERLKAFPGIGVKTAACILLFCFQYPAYAVDTHVWRISKMLGWVPAKADRDQTFFHLDLIIPNELKYGLHQLFIAHGQACGRCSGRNNPDSVVWDATECPLDEFMWQRQKDPVKRRKLLRASLEAPDLPIQERMEAWAAADNARPLVQFHDAKAPKPTQKDFGKWTDMISGLPLPPKSLKTLKATLKIESVSGLDLDTEETTIENVHQKKVKGRLGKIVTTVTVENQAMKKENTVFEEFDEPIKNTPAFEGGNEAKIVINKIRKSGMLANGLNALEDKSKKKRKTSDAKSDYKTSSKKHKIEETDLLGPNPGRRRSGRIASLDTTPQYNFRWRESKR